jgi:hypothetical protein
MLMALRQFCREAAEYMSCGEAEATLQYFKDFGDERKNIYPRSSGTSLQSGTSENVTAIREKYFHCDT